MQGRAAPELPHPNHLENVTFTRWLLTDGNRVSADLIEEAEFLSTPRQDNITGQRPIPAEELSEMALRHLKR